MNNYLIVSNDNYIRYVKSLIYSISKYDKDFYIYLYLINPQKVNLKEIKKKAKKYNIDLRIINNELSQEVNTQKKHLHSEEAAFSANIRVELLKELIETKDLDNLTYIDADSLINKPLDKIYREVDFSFFIRREDVCSSGILSFNLKNKEKILNMLEVFRDRIEEYGLTKWFSDQQALKDIYYEFIKTDLLTFEILPVEYFDWRYSEGSIIWMGKGKKKLNKIYIKLQKKYEELF